MIRTVWLAAFCLAGLGGLYASKVTASISSPESGVADPATVSAGVMPDTLTNADRLDLTGIRPTAEATSALLNEPIVIRRVKAKRSAASAVERQDGTNANVIAVLPKPRPKLRISKSSSPPKLAGDPKRCPQPNSLGTIIMFLTGTSHCG